MWQIEDPKCGELKTLNGTISNPYVAKQIPTMLAKPKENLRQVIMIKTCLNYYCKQYDGTYGKILLPKHSQWKNLTY